MALIIKDRVKEGTVTTGTVAFALGGAASTFEAFNTYMSNGDTAYYAVVHTASGHDEWEVGLGTWNTGNTLTRTTILSSSNSGNAVSFSSGTKDIFMTYPADRAVIEEPDRSVSFPAGISVTGNIAASGTIDGRDVAADGTKLDTIETNADVTDLTNVLAALPTLANNELWYNIGGTLVAVDGTLATDAYLGGGSAAPTGGTATITGNMDISGNFIVGGTVDGVDIATRDAVLTSTTTTANAALPKAGGTVTGNLSLGNNDKVVLGDTSNLQIFSTGTSAYIAESGSGDLYIKGSSVYLTDSDNNQYIHLSDTGTGGTVVLKHNAVSKLTTTSSGISVSGNVVVSGTVDGRDIATDGTKLDGIEANATADQTDAEIRAAVEAATDSNVFTDADHSKLNAIEAGATADQTKSDIEGLGIELPANNLTGTIAAARLSTATTQAESDDSTKIATTAYVSDKITTLIGGAPSTLNDLNELAAAINDDANYNSTLTTALATKLPLAGGTLTGNLTVEANAPYIEISNTGENVGGIKMYDSGGASTQYFHLTYDAGASNTVGFDTGASGEYTFSVNTSEKMRIDSSGNVLIGTASVNAYGASFSGNNYLYLNRDGGNALFVDRGTSDGNLIELRKAGSSVGSIGSVSGALYIGSPNGSDAFAKFNNNSITPSTSAGAARDNAIDLGAGSARFKDLYLSDAIRNGSGNLTLDVSGEIVLDADNGGQVHLKDGGTEYARFFQDANRLFIQTAVSDADILIRGNDGGSVFTALTLDMSDAGTAIFNHDIKLPDSGKAIFGAGDDLQIYHDGSNSVIKDNGTGNIRIQSTGIVQIGDEAFNETFAQFNDDGAVQLYHNNAVKFATTSTGIEVTGNVAATGTVDGRDVATDGAKLDGIASGATNTVGNATHTGEVTGSGALTVADNVIDAGNLKVSGNGSTSQFLRSDGDGTFTWSTPTDTNTTYSVGDGGLTQKNFTTTLKSKLDGIASGATANVGDITGVTAGTNLNGGGSSGGVTVNLDANITLTTVTATNFNTTSDRNTKKDITPIADAVRKVQQLGGYNFTFKDTDEKSSGVIAQEVQEVLPELVQEGDEGHLTVQYGNMVGLLIEAIKEQQTQIDELKEKLNS